MLVALSVLCAGRARRPSIDRVRHLVVRARPRSGRWPRVAALAITVGLAVVSWPLAALPWLLRIAIRVIRRRRRQRQLHHQIVLGLPETIDLARIVISSGATVSETVNVLAARAPEPFAEAFGATSAEVRQGGRLIDTLPAVVGRLGDPVRGLVRALQVGERDGVAVGPLLERARVEGLRVRRHELEVAARRLPVLLLFPLVLCVLPAFVLLTVVPLLASALQNLQG
jgi:Flp pilus assembly protein TadB